MDAALVRPVLKFLPMQLRRLPLVVRAFAAAALLAAAVLWILLPAPTVPVRVRWSEGVAADARVELERRFSLVEGRQAEGATWAYYLRDYSFDNIRELVGHPSAADTQGLHRTRFRPEPVPPGRTAPILAWAVLAGVGAVALVVVWRFMPLVRARPATVAAVAVIVAVITLAYLPALLSGDRLMMNRDFFLFTSRHESVAQSIRQYGELPLRSQWFGGGFYTLPDPEDPTLNPMVLFSVALGAIKGVKVIGYLTMLIAGLGTYAFARRFLGYGQWGALYAALVFGGCLFVPNRMAGGNPNEVVGAFVPLCVLLTALALERRRWAIVAAAFVFYTMITDGQLTAVMAIFFVGVLCALATVPGLSVFPVRGAVPRRFDHRPVACFLTIVAVCVVIGLPRLLPAFEVIIENGGISPMLLAHPGVYSPETIHGLSVDELWKGVLGWGRSAAAETLNRDLVTVGMVPAVLAAVALAVFWRQTMGWGIALLFFSWLILAHHAPVDLLKALWNLPVFDTVYRPYKYFSIQIAFIIAVLGGRTFQLLSQLQPRRAEVVLALVLTGLSVGFLYPRNVSMLSSAFPMEHPDVQPGTFFSVDEEDRASPHPLGAYPYLNVLRNIGTLDNYSPAPIPTSVSPKYIVSEDDRYVENPEYPGEAYVLDSNGANKVTGAEFESNAMRVSVELTSPATVVINQNYHRDWHADRGTLLEHKGLVAVQLTEPGSYRVNLRFHPRSFYAGVILTTLAVLAAVGFRRSWYTGTRPPPST